MTVAYYCVLIAGLLPYVFTVLAKSGKGFNNQAPREYLDKAEGWRKRSHWVQVNSFEMFPLFGLSVIIAHLMHKPQGIIDNLSITFIALRIIYGICYLTNQATLRSIIWFGALLCIIAFYFI
jgi:uncharacterized MAPEG superfamily protein